MSHHVKTAFASYAGRDELEWKLFVVVLSFARVKTPLPCVLVRSFEALYVISNVCTSNRVLTLRAFFGGGRQQNRAVCGVEGREQS